MAQQSGSDRNEAKPAKRPMNRLFRIFAVLLGLGAIAIAVNGAYDVFKVGYWDLPAELGILGILCLGCAFLYLGLTGKG